MQDVNQDKTQTVIQTEQDGLGQRRMVLVGGHDLDHRHNADDQAGTHSGSHQRKIFAARLGDVMFTGTACILGDAQGHQLHVFAQMLMHIVLVAFSLHQGLEQFSICRTRHLADTQTDNNVQHGFQTAHLLRDTL